MAPSPPSQPLPLLASPKKTTCWRYSAARSSGWPPRRWLTGPASTICSNAPTLAAKGNFLIALRDINENTEVTDPLAGYVELPNPLHVREYA